MDISPGVVVAVVVGYLIGSLSNIGQNLVSDWLAGGLAPDAPVLRPLRRFQNWRSRRNQRSALRRVMGIERSISIVELVRDDVYQLNLRILSWFSIFFIRMTFAAITGWFLLSFGIPFMNTANSLSSPRIDPLLYALYINGFVSLCLFVPVIFLSTFLFFPLYSSWRLIRYLNNYPVFRIEAANDLRFLEDAWRGKPEGIPVLEAIDQVYSRWPTYKLAADGSLSAIPDATAGSHPGAPKASETDSPSGH